MRDILAIVLMALAAPAMGEAANRVRPVTLDRSTQYLFTSEHVGDVLRLDVILPIGYAESDATYPVVYVTDSNYLLASTAGTQLAQATDHLPKMILVGIGYDVPAISDTAQIRVRDFSPTCDEEYRESESLPRKVVRICGQLRVLHSGRGNAFHQRTISSKR